MRATGKRDEEGVGKPSVLVENLVSSHFSMTDDIDFVFSMVSLMVKAWLKKKNLRRIQNLKY